MRVLLVVLLAVIAAIANADATPISKLGVPHYIGPIAKGSWSQFSVSITDLHLGDLTAKERVWFGVTPFTGDADMYISTVKFPETPECGHCILNSTSPFDELMHLTRGDSRWPTTSDTFYVGVYAYTQAEFSFNVWTDKTNGTLTEGLPQVGVADILDVVYYEYTVPASENFTISVTPRGGDMDIFVTTDPNTRPSSRANSIWAGTDIGFDTVAIDTTHPKYGGAGTTYYIGIKGYSYNRIFTIFVTLNNNYTRIMEGIPLSTTAEGHQYRYFMFDVTSDYAGHRVTFNLVALKTGSDPDMYITRDISQSHPSPSNCEWCNSGIGSDIREIENAPEGRYYVGVRAFQRKAYFQLTATTEFQSIQLEPGIAVRGHVREGQHTYYRWRHGNIREAFSVVASPWAGTVELYESKTSPNPDENKYERKGSPMGLDRVLNHKAYEDWTPKWYYFGVKGNQDANFTITASTNYSATILRDGYSSYYQYVANKYYKYFIFDITDHDLRDPNNAIAFSVSTFTGDADIFVSMTSKFPTISDYEWKSVEYKSDTAVIYANDPKIADRRRFYIGVYGASSSGSDTGFSILAHKSNSSISLHDGQPVHATVEYDKYVYFRYSVSEIGYKGPIKVTIQVPNSQQRVIAFADDENNHRPTLQHYQWRSSSFGQVFLDIPDARDGHYYIGVLGWALGRNYTHRMIDFTISASRSFEVLNINSGNLLRSLSANAQPDRYRFVIDDVGYYRTSVDYVSVALTLISGRARLYMNPGTNRTDDESYTTSDNAYYRNESPNGNVIMVRKLNEPNHWANHWNVVVYADEHSDYYISASTSTTVRGVAPSPYYATPSIDLFEGVPMLQAAPFQDRFVYSIHLPPVADHEKQDYEISLRILDGIVSVYASQDYSIIPNPRNYTFKAEKVSEDTTIVLKKEMLDQSSFWGGRLFITVYGEFFPMLHGQANKFEITVYHASSPRYLMQDQPLPQRILEDQFRGHDMYTHYRALNSVEHPEDLEVIVVSCEDLPAKVPSVFGSAVNHRPTEGNHTYAGQPIGHFVQYFKTDAAKKADERVFYIGVQNKPNHATARNFTIYATTLDDSRPLIKNHAINGRTENEHSLGDATVTFSVELAQHPKRYFDGKNYIYQVFSRELTQDNINNINNINFATTCAVTNYGTKMNIVHQHYNDTTPGTLEIQAGPFDRSKSYAVNIYVHSESIFGLASTYHPGYVINGNFHATWPQAPGMSGAGIFFLVVFILLLVAVLAFVAYIGIGFAIKKKQGHYGWDAVPQSGLWSKVIRVLTCGKFAPGESYGSLRDETSTSSVNASQSGYGSV